jgi:hypothetical protein
MGRGGELKIQNWGSNSFFFSPTLLLAIPMQQNIELNDIGRTVPLPPKRAKRDHGAGMSGSSSSSDDDDDDDDSDDQDVEPQLPAEEPVMLPTDMWIRIQRISRVEVGCRLSLTCKWASVGGLLTPDKLILDSNKDNSEHDRTDIETLWLTRFLFRVNRKYAEKLGTTVPHYQVNLAEISDIKIRYLAVYFTEHRPGCSPSRHPKCGDPSGAGGGKCKISGNLPFINCIYKICRYTGCILSRYCGERYHTRNYEPCGNIHEATPELSVRAHREVNLDELRAMPSWTLDYGVGLYNLYHQGSICDRIVTSKKRDRVKITPPTDPRLRRLIAAPCYYDDVPRKYRFTLSSGE